MLLENAPCGHCIFLENVSLIEFFYDLKTALVSHKIEKSVEDVIMDMNQSYGLNLLKDGDSLTIETYSEEHGCKVDADYAQALHRIRFASQTFFKDLLYHCPQLEDTDEGNNLREMLM